MKNPFKTNIDNSNFSRPEHQSAGILDDHAVRKATQTIEFTAQKSLSKNVVTDLNSDMLDGKHATDFILSGAKVCYWNLSGTSVYYNDGNVGIGVSDPSEKLEVKGNIKASALNLTTGAQGNTIFKFGAGTNNMYVSATNPNTLNCYYDTDADGMGFYINYRGANDGFSYSRNFYVADGKGNAFVNFIGATQRVGIGTDSPNNKLEVVGTISGTNVFSSGGYTGVVSLSGATLKISGGLIIGVT